MFVTRSLACRGLAVLIDCDAVCGGRTASRNRHQGPEPRTSPAASTASAIQEGPESELEFRGTSIALGAEGEAEVEFQEGRARVDVEVEKLPSPGHLGPFATYVLWAVTADGNANNLGAIETSDGRGELEASTPLSQFALIVTAEPHFAVTAPSRAIVLQNLAKNVRGKAFNVTGLKERIDYSTLSPQTRDEKHEDTPGPRAGALRARDRRGCGRGSPRAAGIREGARASRPGRGGAEGDSASVRATCRAWRAAPCRRLRTPGGAPSMRRRRTESRGGCSARSRKRRAAPQSAAAAAAEAAKRSEAQAAEEGRWPRAQPSEPRRAQTSSRA